MPTNTSTARNLSSVDRKSAHVQQSRALRALDSPGKSVAVVSSFAFSRRRFEMRPTSIGSAITNGMLTGNGTSYSASPNTAL